jgi:hypothetical protein
LVSRTVTDATHRFCLHYLSDRNRDNLFYQTAIGAGHSQVTLTYGLECSDNKDYFTDGCDYDQGGHHPPSDARPADARHVSTRSSPVTDGTAPNGLRVNDISDTAVALAWTPLVGELTYIAYRASGADQNFTAIGTVTGVSFSEAGLSPATSYAYKVTANAGGSE